MFERLVQVRGQLSELVAAIDSDALGGQTARGWWAEFDKVERLAAAGKTLVTRRVAQTHQPGKQATKTAAEELAREGGTTTGQARDAVNTSQRLPDQPGVEGALRRGQLSPAQAAAISAAAEANPAEEDRLVELAALVSLAELREECARVRAAADPDPEATHRRLHAARALRQWIDEEGFWNLHAKGTPAAGAVFTTALQPILEQLFNDARRAGRRESHQAYAFDALLHLAHHATGACTCALGQDQKTGGNEDRTATSDAGAAAGADAPAEPHDNNGTDEPGARASEQPATPPEGAEKSCVDEMRVPGTARESGPDCVSGSAGVSGDAGIFAAGRGVAGWSCAVPAKATINPRYLALLRVDVEALRRGQAQPGELCEIAGVGPVPVSVARKVLGEAIAKLVITDGVDVLNVTHLGRGPTAAQRAALLWANPTCSVQGCNRSRLEWDHRTPWAQTRHTRLDELDGLCSFHHDLKTRLGYALVEGTGKRAFVAPDDPRHPGYRTPPSERLRKDVPEHSGAVGTSRPPGRTNGNGRRVSRRARRQLDLFGQPQPP